MNKEFFLLMLFVIFINLSSCNFRLYKDADLIDVEDIINRYNEEETMSFNNYLISSFSSEIKEENGIYYFSYKGYTYSYDSNNKKVTREENEEESYDYLFNSFTEAKSASLKVGDVIKTSCFYRFSSHGKGKGLYTIVEDNKGLDLPLDNGLFARITGRVSFENLGGYGNNFYNDSPLFDKIFQYKDNYDFKYLYFESNFYVCLSQINMYEVNDLCFIGNNSRLVVNDEYIDTKYNEFFLNISNCHNLLFVNFGVDYDFTKQMNGIKTQVGIHNSKNLEFVKCEYNILNNYRDIQNEVNNFDCYQGWENIIINKCKFNNLSDVEAGGSLWIRDFRNVGSKNIKVLNSSFHKMAHDEIIAVFQGKVEDVLIRNNKDEAMPDMLKIFGYFIKLDNIIAFDEIQLLIDSMGLTISGQQLNLYFKDMDFEEAENRVFYFKAALDDENVNDLLMIGLMICASDGILTSDEQAALDELFHN